MILGDAVVWPPSPPPSPPSPPPSTEDYGGSAYVLTTRSYERPAAFGIQSQTGTVSRHRPGDNETADADPSLIVMLRRGSGAQLMIVATVLVALVVCLLMPRRRRPAPEEEEEEEEEEEGVQHVRQKKTKKRRSKRWERVPAAEVETAIGSEREHPTAASNKIAWDECDVESRTRRKAHEPSRKAHQAPSGLMGAVAGLDSLCASLERPSC